MNTDSENNEVTHCSCSNDFDEFYPSYADLPMEIIIKIFQYLSFTDIQSASLTCRRWCEASQDTEFQAKVLMNFSKIFLTDHTEPMSIFIRSFRSFQNLDMIQVENGITEKFFSHIGGSIESLTVDTVDINEKELIAILKETKNLKTLNISNCSSLFMAGQFFESVRDREILSETMANIRFLSLKLNQYLSDMILLRLTSLTPNIESLDLSGCHIAYHNIIQRRFYPIGHADNPSESILTFKYLLHVIQNHVKTLREIDLSLTLAGGPALIAISEIEGLKLNKLNLSYCRQLNQAGLQSLFQSQRNLTNLDVSFSIYLTDTCVDIIVDNLHSLEVLKLNTCIKVTNASVVNLSQLKKLRVLDLSHCDSVTSDGIMNGIVKEKNETLQELYLTSMDLCELCIIRCSENLPNLRVFDISCCVNGVTDQAVQSIIKNLIWLRALNLEGCSLITDAALTGIDVKSQCDSENKYENCSSDCSSFDIPSESPNNIRISLRSKAEEEIYQDAQRKKAMLAICEMNQCIDDSACEGLSIKLIKGLQSLNLRGCNKISDISLKYGLRFLELRKLYLANCQQISVIGIDALVKNCPSIENIDVSECHNINDKAIESITKYLKRLKSLDISGCTQLTDYSLDYIVLNCKVLQKLSVHRCRRMCSDIDLRLSTLSSLRSINVDRSSNIESVDIIRMKKPMPPWTY